MSLPVLYSFRRCPFAIRARLAIEISAQRCILREVVLRDKPAGMLDASPKGTVPVLVDAAGRVLDESIDIMLWALQRCDPHDWLNPQRGSLDEMHRLIHTSDTQFKHHLDRYKYSARYAGADPLMHRALGAEFLHALDNALAQQGFLFGGRPALADMALVPFVRQFALADRGWFDSQGWDRLKSWLERLVNSRRFQAVMARYPQWHEGDPVTYFPAAAPA